MARPADSTRLALSSFLLFCLAVWTAVSGRLVAAQYPYPGAAASTTPPPYYYYPPPPPPASASYYYYAPPPPPNPFAEQLMAELQAEPEFQRFYEALNMSRSIDMVKGLVNSGVTLFAPVNGAFDALGAVYTECMLKRPGMDDLLPLIVRFHVATGNFVNAQLMTMSSVQSFLGLPIPLTHAAAGGLVLDGQATVTGPDVKIAVNATVHTIDTVMVPYTARRILELLCYNAPPSSPEEANQVAMWRMTGGG
ncbi:hypothetical protein CBR_g57854 [Chara braunii]|uniref:FAS1 domain-containing protein n=1 Tax=Chara braunii TaxID=69332 RepID=A0A388K863_CHABU|nr:hypothetical protein CBR_g57854 [Chara braunii]|eukprot:GBG66252.1 hypothetical protein CBR_g57854 [Chara braunii]